MTKLGEVLKQARLELALSQLDIANKIGTTQSYYNRIENDKVPPPSSYILKKLADILKCNFSQLRELADESRLIFKQKQIEQQYKALGVNPSITRPIPIVNEVPTSTPAEYTDVDYPPGVAEDYYEFKIKDDNAFFLKAEGDCMAPYILKGDLLLISPDGEIKNGDVAAVVNGKGEKEVRRVSIVDDQVVLTANNPIYPTIIWGAKDKPKIIGRVKEIIRRR